MNSEKVKEILSGLHCKLLGDRRNEINHEEINCVGEVITLINELESENERLLEQRNKTFNIWVRDTEKLRDRIAELENIGLNEEITVAEYLREMQRLKDRVAELEKEIEENAFYSKGYADGIKNTYEVVVPEKLKQFAERLKEKMSDREYMGVKYKQGVFSENDIDETLKEFINE